MTCMNPETMQYWETKFDLGYVFPAAFPRFSTDEHGLSLELEKTIGTGLFKAVELATIIDPTERSRVSRILTDSQLKCVYLGGITILNEGLNLSSLDESIRAEAVKRLSCLMDDAEDLGAALFLVSSGPDPDGHLRNEALAQLRRSICALCEHASDIATDQPMTVTLEHYDRDIHHRFLLGPSSETSQFARAVREEHANFGITLDQSHVAQLGETPSSALKELGDAICHVHLANCVVRDSSSPLYGDCHPPFGIDGGEIGKEEISSFVLALQEGGYFDRSAPYGKPIVSIEVRTPGNANPRTTLSNALESVLHGCTAALQQNNGRN